MSTDDLSAAVECDHLDSALAAAWDRPEEMIGYSDTMTHGGKAGPHPTQQPADSRAVQPASPDQLSWHTLPDRRWCLSACTRRIDNASEPGHTQTGWVRDA